MPDHRALAELYLEESKKLSGNAAAKATTHAVLALIDIITGDREEEIQDTNQLLASLGDTLRLAQNRIFELETENQALKLRVRELVNQLDGCNDTVRRHEQAATANAKPNNNDLRESYE